MTFFMDLPLSLAFLIGVCGAILLLFRLRYRHSMEYPLPPSPQGLPFIGHVLTLPTHDEHIGLTEIGKELGSVFSVKICGMLVIVLNSSKDAANLLQKRSGIYSDRAFPPMLVNPALTDAGKSLGFLNYDTQWKKSRRLMHPWFQRKAVEALNMSQTEQTQRLVTRLLTSSGEWTSENLEIELQRSLATTLARYVFGYTSKLSDDPILLGLRTATKNIVAAALPTSFLVNLFPVLLCLPEWLPGMSWKRLAHGWRAQHQRAIDAAYDWSKAQIASGTNEPCMVASLLKEAKRLDIPPDEIDEYVKQIAMGIFIAGPDTMTSTLLIFFLVMVTCPEVQKRAQQEIDAIVSSTRLPTIADRQQLAYISRLIIEVLRWRPIAPLGMPHATSQDDVYEGYRIPKGATVVANVWAITRDETVYKEPERFDPDRFLDPKVPCPPAFGFGRRECPGAHYAEAALFVVITSILATFDILPAKDEDGRDIIPLAESADQVPYHHKPFRLRFSVRSISRVDGCLSGDTLA